MSAPAYFIADDAAGDLWIWRKDGDERPKPVGYANGTEPDLLARIRAAVEGEVREEWGVRTSGHIFDGWTEGDARVYTEKRDGSTPVRRTVITGAWEEER